MCTPVLCGFLNRESLNPVCTLLLLFGKIVEGAS